MAGNKQKQQAPVVRVRSRGVISGTLERYAARYREQYPGRDVRYVYDPQHKPELSGVVGRQATGYELVTYGELQMDLRGVKDDDVVRVGDLVLMSIDKETRAALKAEREQDALEQRQMVKRSYYEQIEKDANAAAKEGYTRPPSHPIGDVTIEDKVFEYDVEQRKGEE